MKSNWIRYLSAVDLASGGWQPGRVQDAAALATLQAQLARARGEWALQQLDSTARILSDLIPVLRRNLQRNARADRAQDALLLASARSLEGRLLRRCNQDDQAADAFSESASLFQSYASDLDSQQSKSRLYTDYGIALFRLGRQQEAVDILKNVCQTGVVPAEAFGYLGLAYNKQNRFTEAEEALRKGLQLAPGDPVLSSALAETLDESGRQAEAMSAYCEAALAMARNGDLPAASRLLGRALEIQPTDEQALTMAVAILRTQGNEAGARALLDRTLRIQPGHPWARGLQAMLLRDAGDLTGAIDAFRAVDVQSPDLAWVLVEHAKALHKTSCEHDQEALGLLERAMQLNAEDAGALLAKSEILREKDPNQAAALLEQAIDLDPESALLRLELGRARYAAGNSAAASDAFDQALRLDPKSVPALYAKAEVLAAGQRYEEALEMYRRALRLEPHNEAILESLVNMLLESGQVQEALDELDRALALNPKSTVAWRKKGRVLLAANRPSEACATLESAARFNPDDPGIQTDLADALRGLDRYDEAAAAFDRALHLDPNSADVMGMKAFYLCAIAAFEDARGLLDQAVAREPNRVWLLLLLGWVCQHLGDKARPKARTALEKAVKLDSDNPWNQKTLANVLYELGERDEANKIYTNLIEHHTYVHTADASLIALVGWCHYRLKAYDEALRLLQSSLSVDPDYISAHFDLALTLLASGKADAGSAEYQQASDRAKTKHPLRQRGLFYVALYDLVWAAKDQLITAGGYDNFAKLRSALAESGIDLAKLSWLPNSFPSAAAI